MFRKRTFSVSKHLPPLNFTVSGYVQTRVKFLRAELMHQFGLAIIGRPCRDIVRLRVQKSLDPLPLARVLYFLPL